MDKRAVHWTMKRPMSLCMLSVLITSVMAGQRADHPEPPDTLYKTNQRYWARCAMWEADTVRSAAIVMLGNSITEGGDWTALLDRDDVSNRGIGSDNTYGFRARMRYVYAMEPRVCFIMGGINDIYAGFTVETIVRNYAAILDSLRNHGILPVAQSTLFASPRWRLAREKNLLVEELNGIIEQLCRVRGIPYIDLNSRLSADGVLREEYTTDGIHLTAEAYTVWSDLLRALLQTHGI